MRMVPNLWDGGHPWNLQAAARAHHTGLVAWRCTVVLRLRGLRLGRKARPGLHQGAGNGLRHPLYCGRCRRRAQRSAGRRGVCRRVRRGVRGGVRRRVRRWRINAASARVRLRHQATAPPLGRRSAPRGPAAPHKLLHRARRRQTLWRPGTDPHRGRGEAPHRAPRGSYEVAAGVTGVAPRLGGAARGSGGRAGACGGLLGARTLGDAANISERVPWRDRVP